MLADAPTLERTTIRATNAGASPPDGIELAKLARRLGLAQRAYDRYYELPDVIDHHPSAARQVIGRLGRAEDALREALARHGGTALIVKGKLFIAKESLAYLEERREFTVLDVSEIVVA